jgi:hypothetical protein
MDAPRRSGEAALPAFHLFHFARETATFLKLTG